MNPGAGHSALILCCGLFLVSCGSARRGEPLVGPKQPPTAEIALGKRAFDNNCAQCHPGGTGGLGLPINNRPFPAWVIKLQVRTGMGAMPAFSDADLSDEELDAVAEYLIWLRRQEAEPTPRGREDR